MSAFPQRQSVHRRRSGSSREPANRCDAQPVGAFHAGCQRQCSPPKHILSIGLAQLDRDHGPTERRRRIRRQDDIDNLSAQFRAQRVNRGTPRETRRADEAGDDHHTYGERRGCSRGGDRPNAIQANKRAGDGKRCHRLERNLACPTRWCTADRHRSATASRAVPSPSIPRGRNAEDQPERWFQDEDGVSEVPRVVDRIERMHAVAVESCRAQGGSPARLR